MNKNYRQLFNGIETKVMLEDGSEVTPINFDNAATTPPLKQVDDFINQNICMYGSVGRGGHKSSYCTNAYEVSRQEILDFFNLRVDDGYEVIYVKNTTEGMNLLAHMLCGSHDTKILTTRLEHHANDLPWRGVGKPYYCEVTAKGTLDLDEVEEKLKRARGTISYVSVTGTSNVTGYMPPIHEIAQIAHRYGAHIIVDAAQLVAHRKICIKSANEAASLDAIVFSGHKMYAPFGSGVVIVRKELLKGKSPWLLGGGSVEAVFDEDVYYKDTPYKEEAGTPNFLGVMSIVAAITVLKSIGYECIREHEWGLTKKLTKGLQRIPGVTLYSEGCKEDRVGVIPFNLEGMHHQKVGELLQNRRAIAVRTGCFCAHPYVMRLLGVSNEERYQYFQDSNMPSLGMIRASFALYNTEEEVDMFLNCIEDILKGRTIK